MNQVGKRRARPLDPGRRTIRGLVSLAVLEGASLEQSIRVAAVREVESTLDCWFEDPVLCLFAESHLEVLREAGIDLEGAIERTERAREEDLPPEYVAIGRIDEETFLCAPRHPDETTSHLYLFDSESRGARPMSAGRWLEEKAGLYRERFRNGSDEQQSRVDESPSELQLAKYRPDMIPEPSPDVRVRHPKFGTGTVVDEYGSGESTKYEIEFDDETRTILAEYVELL
jgi:hypothetical protein